VRSNGEQKELRDEIVDLGTRYGIVTPYTSYLATDGTLANAAPTDSRQMGLLRAEAAKSMRVQSGAGAVQQSVQQNTLQSNVTVMADAAAKNDKDKQILIQNSTQNQFVANKNFVNTNGHWVDSDYTAETRLPVVEIKFASDEYFRLTTSDPQLAQYLALGEQVTVVWKGKVYKVVR